MILNLILIVALLAVAVLYASFGLFSAFLQVVATLIAGALAFALWEPIAALLANLIPGYASAVGLVVPFGLLLLLIRYGLDKAAPSDLKFPGLVDQLAGAAVGLIAGALTLGVVLLGAQFLPLPVSLLGYQPYELDARGRPTPTANLWVPVDAATADVYQFLSAGAFSSSTPLHRVYPDLHRSAATSRLAAEAALNQAAAPSALTVTAAGELDRVPGALADAFPDGATAYAIEIEHAEGTAGGFDSDNKLRVPAYQSALLTEQGQELFPLGFRREAAGTDNAGIDGTVFATDEQNAIAVLPAAPGTLTWYFAIPAGDAAAAYRFRNARLGLTPTTPTN